MRQRLSILLLAALLACAGATAAAAADPVGQMVVERGMVKLRRGESEQVHRASPQPVPLFVGDQLQSAAETRAALTFRGQDQKVNLYSNSFFRVDDVQPTRSLFRLAIGKAIFAVLKLTGAQRFEVRTPTAVIGVKGTEFVVGTDGSTKTFLLTTDGVVSLASAQFPTREVLVRKDQASFHTKGEAPTPPVDVTPEVRESIKQEDGLETFQDVEATAPPPPASSNGEDQEEEQTAETETPGLPEDVQEALDTVQETRDTIETTTEATKSDPSAEVNIRITR